MDVEEEYTLVEVRQRKSVLQSNRRCRTVLIPRVHVFPARRMTVFVIPFTRMYLKTQIPLDAETSTPVLVANSPGASAERAHSSSRLK